MRILSVPVRISEFLAHCRAASTPVTLKTDPPVIALISFATRKRSVASIELLTTFSCLGEIAHDRVSILRASVRDWDALRVRKGLVLREVSTPTLDSNSD